MSDSDTAYHAMYLQSQEETKQLKARIEELEQQVIHGFYENEWPMYNQGPPLSEQQELTTAKEINALIEIIKKAYPEGRGSI